MVMLIKLQICWTMDGLILQTSNNLFLLLQTVQLMTEAKVAHEMQVDVMLAAILKDYTAYQIVTGIIHTVIRVVVVNVQDVNGVRA